MFCDLVGSTELSARLDPEDLRKVIAAYHRAVGEVVAVGNSSAATDHAAKAAIAGFAGLMVRIRLPPPKSQRTFGP
jgi:class 3 adenylate cyclase